MLLKYLIPFLTFCSLNLFINTAQSQNKKLIPFQHIQDGMSQSSATVLLEDKFGFIWVGTRNGLNRYDGQDFKIFTKSLDGKTGLMHEYIVSLYEDDENSENDHYSPYGKKENEMFDNIFFLFMFFEMFS